MPTQPAAHYDVAPRTALPHFETFARMRQATMADFEALQELERAVENGGGSNDWERFIATAGHRVVLALECETLVGAVVTTRAGALVSRLVWFGVALSARRRGVGHLLIETVTEQAASDGVRALRLPQSLIGYGVHRLMLDAGFDHTSRGYDKRVRGTSHASL